MQPSTSLPPLAEPPTHCVPALPASQQIFDLEHTDTTMLDPQVTLNCNGLLLSLEEPLIMGIINLTPDSFYSDSRFEATDNVLRQVDTMLRDGADIIDLGGMSSRPGSAVITEAEERQRVMPALRAVVQRFPEAVISLDTVRAGIAREGVTEGARLINDISAGRLDEAMYVTVGELGVPYVLMHMQGRPETMQQAPVYEDVVVEVLDFFAAEVAKLRACGVHDIILDPGFGFGKAMAHNYQLLRSLHAFQLFDLPVLAGLSRKGMIYRLLDISPEEALNGTTALHVIALQQGCRLLRVHDVKEAVQVRRLWQMCR